MKKLEWKQDNMYCWSLYDDGVFAGIVSYNHEGSEYAGQWGGTFYISDKGQISLNPAGTTVLQAKDKIQDNYLQDRNYDWWTQ